MKIKLSIEIFSCKYLLFNIALYFLIPQELTKLLISILPLIITSLFYSKRDPSCHIQILNCIDKIFVIAQSLWVPVFQLRIRSLSPYYVCTNSQSSQEVKYRGYSVGVCKETFWGRLVAFLYIVLSLECFSYSWHCVSLKEKAHLERPLVVKNQISL